MTKDHVSFSIISLLLTKLLSVMDFMLQLELNCDIIKENSSHLPLSPSIKSIDKHAG